ncbi:hypothetical protein OIV48_31235, partial [Burkholderia pseudomallei]|nr:hypothetical protein [Burkholderia pseudomallei]
MRRSTPPRVLRERIALVFQHAAALDVSIAANIAPYRHDASRDDIRADPRAAVLDQLIAALPRGEDRLDATDVLSSVCAHQPPCLVPAQPAS